VVRASSASNTSSSSAPFLRVRLGLRDDTSGIQPHLAYQTKLELDGTMFAAGPLASDDLLEWLGEGLFVYHAESIKRATQYAEADPMHTSGARAFTIREWLLNPGISVHEFGPTVPLQCLAQGCAPEPEASIHRTWGWWEGVAAPILSGPKIFKRCRDTAPRRERRHSSGDPG
jgi:uncharacterized protein YciI